jgi:hypothetical protein
MKPTGHTCIGNRVKGGEMGRKRYHNPKRSPRKNDFHNNTKAIKGRNTPMQRDLDINLLGTSFVSSISLTFSFPFHLPFLNDSIRTITKACKIDWNPWLFLS